MMTGRPEAEGESGGDDRVGFCITGCAMLADGCARAQQGGRGGICREREGGGGRDGLYLGDCGGGVRWRLEAWKGGDMDGVV